MKRVLLLVLILQANHAWSMLADTVEIRNLNYDWFFYDEDDGFLPLVDKSVFTENTIHFDIGSGDYSESILSISSSDKINIFINGMLAAGMKGKILWNIDSLRRSFNNDLHVTLYRPLINPYNITAKIIRLEPTAEKKPLIQNPVLIKSRNTQKEYNNFIIVASILLLMILASLRNFFPRTLADFFRLRRVLSTRDIDENLFKTRPLNQIHLLVYAFLSLLISLTIMLFVRFSEIHQDAAIFYPIGFSSAILSWLKIGLVVFVWYLVKYLLIANLSALFKISFFQNSHFYTYTRLSFLIFSISLILVIISFFGFHAINPSYYTYLFHFLLIMMILRVLILFFRLLNTGAYKSLHLFSYLCGTEVIPLVVLLYLGLNQPF